MVRTIVLVTEGKENSKPLAACSSILFCPEIGLEDRAQPVGSREVESMR